MSILGETFTKFEDENLSDKFSAQMEFCKIDPRSETMERLSEWSESQLNENTQKTLFNNRYIYKFITYLI
jgi:hypothetical protein